jgi:hypothetical protein
MPSCLLIVTLLRVLDEGDSYSVFLSFFFSPFLLLLLQAYAVKGNFLHQASKTSITWSFETNQAMVSFQG